MTEILLVRHGQTEWNRFPRFRGRTDIPLNDFGRKQAQAAGEYIAARWQVTAVYASPLSRTVQTAQAIAGHYDLPVLPEPGLLDLDFGEWQGKTPEEVRAAWPELFAAWRERPQEVRIPGGETLDEMRARAWKAVQALAGAHPGETIVLVSHMDVNRAILLSVLGWPTSRIYELGQENCAVNQIFAEDGLFRAGTLNETRHLAALGEGGV